MTTNIYKYIESFFKKYIRESIYAALPYKITVIIKKKQERKKLNRSIASTPSAQRDFMTKTPQIYNSDQKKMDLFYIKDNLFPQTPYSSCGRFPEKILWDRYNTTLKTHFYTHSNILSTTGNPDKKYAWFIESEAISPSDFTCFENNKGLNVDFDLIFTHSERMLDQYENARFSPGSGVWYGGIGGGVVKKDAYLYKKKDISMVSSDKVMCELHRARIGLAHSLKRNPRVDLMGTFNGNSSLINIADSLEDYRYSIVMENDIKSVYFTEKIMNCFASMTIPIYLGATRIDQFFNTDGIIQFDLKDIDKFDKIINQCSEKDYLSRLKAMEDNYNRVKQYFTIEDFIYNNYLSEND